MDKILSFITAGTYGTIRETFANDMQHTGYTIVTNSVLIAALFAISWFMYHDKVSANGVFIKAEEVEAIVKQIEIDAKRGAISAQINSLLYKNADLEIQRLYVETANKRNMTDALIKRNEKQIEQLRHEEDQIKN